MKYSNMHKQNPRMAEFGRDLWRSCGPSPAQSRSATAGGLGPWHRELLWARWQPKLFLWWWRNQKLCYCLLGSQSPSAVGSLHKHTTREPVSQVAVCMEQTMSMCMWTREHSRQDNFMMHHMTIKGKKTDQPLSLNLELSVANYRLLFLQLPLHCWPLLAVPTKHSCTFCRTAFFLWRLGFKRSMSVLLRLSMKGMHEGPETYSRYSTLQKEFQCSQNVSPAFIHP